MAQSTIPPGHAMLGPMVLPGNAGTLCSADRHAIKLQYSVSASTRARRSGVRVLTACGPQANLEAAWSMALDKISKNGAEGGRVDSTNTSSPATTEDEPCVVGDIIRVDHDWDHIWDEYFKSTAGAPSAWEVSSRVETSVLTYLSEPAYVKPVACAPSEKS